MSEPLLRVDHLKKYFKSAKGTVHAVDDVSFTIEKGKTLGVVGESGCGKSTLGRTIIRLQEPTEGTVLFEGKNISALNQKELWKQRREMQMIFQDPYSSLNPRRQRIGIARALALQPKFIVCDEPVSALDVSIQAQILNLMQDLQKELNLTYMFITHDLSVVHHISDDIMVMYLGQVIEKAPAEVLFANPVHPYTQALLSAIPVPSLHNRKERILMKGELTSPIDPKPECRFCSRCPYAEEMCHAGNPALKEIEAGHFVACCKFGV